MQSNDRGSARPSDESGRQTVEIQQRRKGYGLPDAPQKRPMGAFTVFLDDERICVKNRQEGTKRF